MDRNYIIFFWIICLILFTFYCVFRLKNMSDIYTSNINNSNINNSNSKKLTEKYGDMSGSYDNEEPQVEYTGPNLIVEKPLTTAPPKIIKENDIISYIKNIQSAGKVMDMYGCDTLYDDNYKVQELGYKNCGDAYADYLDKNYDLNNNYGNTNTLAEICPISSKSAEYNKCLQLLLSKFTDNANLVDNINTDMNTSINTRLNARSENLYKLQTAFSPLLYSKVQTNFNNDMLMKKQVGKTPDDKLRLINNYYQDRYQNRIETFTNNIEQFTTMNIKNIKDIEKLFFGKYKAVRGQFINLADLVYTIEYDSVAELSIQPTIPNTTNANTNATSPQAEAASAAASVASSLSPLSLKQQSRPVLFTLSNNDIYITYKVSNLDYYKSNKNAVQLILTDKTIINQSSPTNIIEPLLQHLGLYSPTNLTIVYDKYTSTEKIPHDTYKLVNDNLDTILVLEKFPSPKTTKPNTLL